MLPTSTLATMCALLVSINGPTWTSSKVRQDIPTDSWWRLIRGSYENETVAKAWLIALTTFSGQNAIFIHIDMGGGVGGSVTYVYDVDPETGKGVVDHSFNSPPDRAYSTTLRMIGDRLEFTKLGPPSAIGSSGKLHLVFRRETAIPGFVVNRYPQRN